MKLGRGRRGRCRGRKWRPRTTNHIITRWIKNEKNWIA